VGLEVVTWNIHGSARPDLDAIASRLEGFAADVVALQEVQRGQARALASRLQSVTALWSFKHLPFGNPAEGLAVLGPHRLIDARTVVLSQGAPLWSYRRRIAQLCTLAVEGRVLCLANCHLSSDDAGDRRAQAGRLVVRLETETIVAGDLNARPGGTLLRRLSRSGLRDAWAALHPDAGDAEGATNWGRLDPETMPSNRLDYILVPAGFQIVAATVPSAVDSDLRAYRRLSDHLPLHVEIAALGNDGLK
jgi:endonuclease/exonuclease/phosphatase family metal-dependent hydrolase